MKFKIPWFNRGKKAQPSVYDARLPDDEGNARIEPYSPTWLFVMRWAEESLLVLRRKLESPKCSHDLSQLYRGEIRRLKKLKNLAAREDARAGRLARLDAGEDEDE